MIRLVFSSFFILHSSFAFAIDPTNPPEGRFSDDWAEIYLSGNKIGYAHSTMARKGETIETGTTMSMRIGRIDQPVKITVTQGTNERLDGTPLNFESVQELAAMKQTMRGTIRGGKVTLVSSQYGMEQKQEFNWPASSLMTWGMYRESMLRGFQPGTVYTLSVYAPELRLDDAVKATTTVGDWETFEHKGTKQRGQKVTVKMDSPIGSLEMISWVDKEGRSLKAKVPAPGIGDMELITTDQATALADFVPPELFATTTIKAKQPINAKAAQRIRYRITATKPKVELDLPAGGMQTIGERSAQAVEVILSRQEHKASGGGDKSQVGAPSEYLEENMMINTADPKLIELAKEAGGKGDSEPFVLADRLRRFVTDYVQNKSLNIGFATASEVARTREGDCSEHGVLLAALGRLNGLPSRVAVGLAYVPVFGKQEDIFGYHMWTQFYIEGRWVDFDAALKESQCSPTRIAFAVSSLKNAGLADLSLPLLDKIGSIDIDILEVVEGNSPNGNQ